MERKAILTCLSLSGLFALSACGPTGGQSLDIPRSPNSATGQPGAPTPDPTVPARPSSDANIQVCAAGTTIAGTDVDDSGSIQWPTVYQAGNDFAFIKATEGITFVNPDFATDWTSAKTAGLVRSAYHFFRPEDDPIKAAQAFLATVGTLAADDLAPMLDWEVTDNVDNATAIQNAQAWLDFVEAATGKTPIIYVDPTFFNALGNPAQFARYPLYIANYLVNCPTVPPPWSNWTFWQTGIGTINGITGQSDLDVFNGTTTQLLSFVTNGTL